MAFERWHEWASRQRDFVVDGEPGVTEDEYRRYRGGSPPPWGSGRPVAHDGRLERDEPPGGVLGGIRLSVGLKLALRTATALLARRSM